MQNAINWFEIPASDLDRAIRFYSTIFDTIVEKRDFMGEAQGFFPYEEPGVGGVILQNPQYTPSSTGTLIYLNAGSADGLDAALSRVDVAGGKTLMGRTDIGDPGFVGIILDSEGNKVGLHAPRG